MLPIGAQAEVTVYGHVHNGIMSKSYEDAQPGGTAKDTTTDVNTNGSRFGFNASGDLGNGLNALAKLEFGVGTDDADNGIGTRHGFVGVSGGFGKVTVGQQSGAFHTSVHTDQSIWQAGIGGISPGSRTPNTIKYSNAVGPLSIQADLRLSDENSSNGPQGDGGAIGLRAAVSDNLTLAVAFDTDDSTNIVTTTPAVLMTGAAGSTPTVKTAEKKENGKETDFVGVSGLASFGNFWGSLAWVQKDETSADGQTNTVTDFTQLWAGVHLTDSTQAVFGYGQKEKDEMNAKTPTATTFGVSHDLGGGLKIWYEGKVLDDDDPKATMKDAEATHQIGLWYIF